MGIPDEYYAALTRSHRAPPDLPVALRRSRGTALHLPSSPLLTQMTVLSSHAVFDTFHVKVTTSTHIQASEAHNARSGRALPLFPKLERQSPIQPKDLSVVRKERSDGHVTERNWQLQKHVR